MTSDDAREAPHTQGRGGNRAEPPFWNGIGEIYALMSRARRRQLHYLLLLMLIGAIAELATIGAVLPFLALLAQPTGVDNLAWSVDLLGALGATTSRARLIAAGLIFSGLAVVAGAIRVQLAWSMQDFVFRLGHELLVEIQRDYQSGVAIPVVPLDSLELSAKMFWKIDVEGFEWSVIQGARQTIESCRPDMICEILPGFADAGAIAEFLKPLGYRFYISVDEGMSERSTLVPDESGRDWLFTTRQLQLERS